MAPCSSQEAQAQVLQMLLQGILTGEVSLVDALRLQIKAFVVANPACCATGPSALNPPLNQDNDSVDVVAFSTNSNALSKVNLMSASSDESDASSVRVSTVLSGPNAAIDTRALGV